MPISKLNAYDTYILDKGRWSKFDFTWCLCIFLYHTYVYGNIFIFSIFLYEIITIIAVSCFIDLWYTGYTIIIVMKSKEINETW